MMTKLKRIVNNMNLSKVRFWIQLITFVLFVYGGYLAIDLGSRLPIFACPYNDGAPGACYMIPLQHQLGMNTEVLFNFAWISFLIGFATFILWFIFLNKAWCGYACPLGTLQDWLTMLRKSFGIRYGSYKKEHHGALSKVKYIFLAIVILIPLFMGMGLIGHDWSAAYCKMCPARVILPMFSGDFSQWNIDFSSTTAIVLTSLGMIFAGLLLVGSFMKKRFFCYFCPMSAMHYIFSPLSFIKLKKDGAKCTKCGDCYSVCDMQIRDIADDVKSTNILRDDCILCLKCVAACPEEDALHFDIFNIKAFSSTKEGFEKRMGMDAHKGESHD
jgi:ferredoxin-type protein NapH